MPASLDVNVNEVPCPGKSVVSPALKLPAVGGVVSPVVPPGPPPPGPPPPVGSACGSIGTTRIACPAARQTAKPVPGALEGPASTIGLVKVSPAARFARP